MILSQNASLWLWSKLHHGPETDELVGVKPSSVNRHPHKFSDVPGDWYLWVYYADEDAPLSGRRPFEVVLDIVERRADHIRRFVGEQDGIAQVRFTWDTDNGDGGITLPPLALAILAKAHVSLVLQGYFVSGGSAEPTGSDVD